MSHPACDHLGKMAFSASHPPRFYLAATTVISISILQGVARRSRDCASNASRCRQRAPEAELESTSTML
jgi:hypothetical protein